MPEPKDVYLPTMPETRLDDIDSEPEGKFGETVHPSLLGLRAANYKGTFKKAYSLLTEMTSAIGWDQLLKIRSQVFVMEEEYRHERVPEGKRNPSTDVIRGTPPHENGHDEDDESTEEQDSSIVENGNPGDAASEAGAAVEKPELSVPKAEAKAGNEDVSVTFPPPCFFHSKDTQLTPPTPNQPDTTTETLSRFNNKRLCERWLDGLFMVLYEDLRIYTIWRTEMAQYRAQSLTYKKSAEEWEILGALAERLHHPAEAAEAYRACLALRFSPRALKGVVDEYERNTQLTGQRDVREEVAALIRLITWQYRWYSEFSPELLLAVRRLIEEEGALKVRSVVQASGVAEGALRLTHHYAALCAAFRSSGTEV
jgi:hypothetical protein